MKKVWQEIYQGLPEWTIYVALAFPIIATIIVFTTVWLLS